MDERPSAKRNRYRLGIGLALFFAWTATLAWMTWTSSKPPADRGLPAIAKAKPAP